MSKSELLRLQLKGLDSALIPASSKGKASPMAPKTNDGSDRYGGFPPA